MALGPGYYGGHRATFLKKKGPNYPLGTAATLPDHWDAP